MSLKLYGYWRSSATYRVRIALNLKQLQYECLPVHLLKSGGEQHKADYQQLNPAELVPTFINEEGMALNQSLAILEYLDENYPSVQKLLPSCLLEKARIRAFCQDIACDIQPLGNLRVLQFLRDDMECLDARVSAWAQYWMVKGFMGLERRLQMSAGQYCFGDGVSMADLCLIPQTYNAKRFSVDLSAFPLIERIYQNCQQLPAFDAAKPENQIDAESALKT